MAHLRRFTTRRYPHSDFRPTFSPDGTRIAFVSDRRYSDLCCFDLFAGSADGTHLHRIPTGLLNGIFDPAWGPNAGGAGSPKNLPRVIPGQRRSPGRRPRPAYVAGEVVAEVDGRATRRSVR